MAFRVGEPAVIVRRRNGHRRARRRASGASPNASRSPNAPACQNAPGVWCPCATARRAAPTQSAETSGAGRAADARARGAAAPSRSSSGRAPTARPTGPDRDWCADAPRKSAAPRARLSAAAIAADASCDPPPRHPTTSRSAGLKPAMPRPMRRRDRDRTLISRRPERASPLNQTNNSKPSSRSELRVDMGVGLSSRQR